MNLKRASVYLMIGLLYVIIYKIIKGLCPVLTDHRYIDFSLSMLWILATFTIILFIVYFLKEIKPVDIRILIPLYSIIFFTGIIIIFKLPFPMPLVNGLAKRLLIKSSGLLNAISIILFLTSFYKMTVANDLKKSVKLMIWGFLSGLVISLISFGGQMYFAISKTESDIFSKIQILAILVFAFTYYTIISFLIRFIKIKDYTKIL